MFKGSLYCELISIIDTNPTPREVFVGGLEEVILWADEKIAAWHETFNLTDHYVYVGLAEVE